MSTFDKNDKKPAVEPAVSSAQTSSSNAEVDWEKCVPAAVGTEDAMGQDDVKKAWEKIYAATGFATATESERRSVRLALYVYAVQNGTSPVGKYSADIKTSGGRVFNASVIPQCVGRNAIREFFRGNMDEAYVALKKSHAVETLAPRYVQSWEQRGIRREVVFATADFLRNCTKFTPEEAKANLMSFNFGVERARRSRGGRTMEQVEREETAETLDAQGPAVGGSVSRGVFDF